MNQYDKLSAGNAARAYNEPQQIASSPIPAAVGQLSSAIHEMGILADSLAARLGVVMMPCAPTSESKDRAIGSVAPAASQQTEEIHGLRRRVENIAAQLQDVLNRLEV